MSDTQATDVAAEDDHPGLEAQVEAQEGPAETSESVETPESAEAADSAERAEHREASEAGDAGGEVEGSEAAAPAARTDKRSRLRQLEREGEVAADFLETLLDIADLDGDIDVDVDGDRAAIAIVDSEEGRVPRRLVGQDGRVLEALQELTRLAVQAQTGERSRLMLDIAGHRAARRAALVDMAAKAIEEVKASGTKQALEPMTAFERKVVHDEVAAAGLVSESEGVEPNRHVIILPS